MLLVCCCRVCDGEVGAEAAVAARVCALTAEIAAAVARTVGPGGGADDGGPFAAVVPGEAVTLTALWFCDAIVRDSLRRSACSRTTTTTAYRIGGDGDDDGRGARRVVDVVLDFLVPRSRRGSVSGS